MRPVGMYTDALRPKGNRPATGGHVDGRFAPESKPDGGRWPMAGGHKVGRFAPESKPAYGRWACTRTLCAQNEIGLQPVGM